MRQNPWLSDEPASAVLVSCEPAPLWVFSQLGAECLECVVDVGRVQAGVAGCADGISSSVLVGALLAAEHVKDSVRVSVEEGKDNKLRVSE